MSKRIPSWFINELLNKVDIVDIIRAKINLKKAGVNYLACCPFHHEKTASFTVSQSKQFFYCFGCGVHGSALGFIMDFEQVSFPAAINKLANILGIALPHNIQSELEHNTQNKQHYLLLNQAANYWCNNLRSQQAKAAVAYLKQRGLTGQIAKEFKLGFANDHWTTLRDYLLQQGWTLVALKNVGLIKEKATSSYDYFRNRIIFPIRNRQGQIIAFGGRVIIDGNPKYLNSPETSLFHKRSALYGLYESLYNKSNVLDSDSVVVVEGYMDVLALHQLGIKHAVACLGTAINVQHIKQLFGYYNTLVFCFDGDKAGNKAALRALEVSIELMEEGRECRFVFLPTGDDPDNFIRAKGLDVFKQYLLQAGVLSRYLIDYCSKQCELASIEGRAKLIGLIRPYLKQMLNNSYRQLVVDALAQIVLLDITVLQELLFKNIDKSSTIEKMHSNNNSLSPVRRLLTKNKNKKCMLTPALRMISLILQHNRLANLVSNKQLELFKHSQHKGCRLIYKVLYYFENNSGESLGALLELIKQDITAIEADFLLGTVTNCLCFLTKKEVEIEFIASLNKILSNNQLLADESKIYNLINVNLADLSQAQKQQIKELYK